MLKSFIIFFSFIVSLSSGLAQEINEADVDALVNNTLESFDVPGIAVGVIHKGEPVIMKGYGVRSLESNEKVDANTLFGIASNSKAFTAAALSILVKNGKMTWDDRVIDYIPEFRLYDAYVTQDFRIRDLLCHRSGMGLGAGDLMIWPDGTDFTTKDVIHNLRYLKQVSPFRTKYDYDNLLYIVAGEIIAKVSGLSWEDFIEEQIMKPLDMSSSAASYNRLKNKTNVIDPHAPVEGRVQLVSRTTNELMNAAGGIYSSVNDLRKWCIELLEDDKKVLDQGQVKYNLWAPQTILPVYNPGRYNTHFSAYGLGFRLTDEAGYKVISHTGGLAGMVSKVTLIPELELAIIVLTNQQAGGAFSAISNEIKDHYFGMAEDVDWVKDYSTAGEGNSTNADKIVNAVWEVVESNKIKNTGSGLVIAGIYKDPWLGIVRITEKDKRYFFKAERSPGLDGEIFFYRGNTYVVKWKDRSMDADAFLLFQLDLEGKAEGFTMKAISPLTDFSYDFHDLNFVLKK